MRTISKATMHSIHRKRDGSHDACHKRPEFHLLRVPASAAQTTVTSCAAGIPSAAPCATDMHVLRRANVWHVPHPRQFGLVPCSIRGLHACTRAWRLLLLWRRRVPN